MGRDQERSRKELGFFSNLRLGIKKCAYEKMILVISASSQYVRMRGDWCTGVGYVLLSYMIISRRKKLGETCPGARDALEAA